MSRFFSPSLVDVIGSDPRERRPILAFRWIPTQSLPVCLLQRIAADPSLTLTQTKHRLRNIAITHPSPIHLHPNPPPLTTNTPPISSSGGDTLSSCLFVPKLFFYFYFFSLPSGCTAPPFPPLQIRPRDAWPIPLLCTCTDGRLLILRPAVEGRSVRGPPQHEDSSASIAGQGTLACGRVSYTSTAPVSTGLGEPCCFESGRTRGRSPGCQVPPRLSTGHECVDPDARAGL